MPSCSRSQSTSSACSHIAGHSAPETVTSPDEQAEAQCRLCWGTVEDGPLLSPCKCDGSLKWIHTKCLAEWLELLHSQGLHKKAKRCEICLSPWKGPIPKPGWSPDSDSTVNRRSLALRVRHMIMSLHASLRHPGSLPTLAYRVWKLWVMSMALKRAFTMGGVGMRTGVQLGRTLIREQSAAVGAFLAAVADLLGTPTAEVLWIQTAAAVGFGLASEFAYSVILGTVCGAAYGLFSGWWEALATTATVAHTGARNVVVGVWRAGWKLLRLLNGTGQLARRAVQWSASLLTAH